MSSASILRSRSRRASGSSDTGRLLIVNLETPEGRLGRGECVATEEPRYSSETVETARGAILSFLLPPVFRMRSVDPAAFRVAVAPFRGNAMAKAAVEGALWDLAAQQHRRSLSHELGGRRTRIEVGVSVGIQPTVAGLVRRVGRYLDEGYRLVKLKVRPGWDARPVGAVRREFPDLRLWVDANQAYPPRSLDAIRKWAERYEVEQVEQPFPEHAFSAHARLARGAPFKVCLDESIVDPWSLEDALDRGSLTSLNVKAGRVGGLGIGLEMGKRAARARLPAWVGGMLETVDRPGWERGPGLLLPVLLPRGPLRQRPVLCRRYRRARVRPRSREHARGSPGPGLGVSNRRPQLPAPPPPPGPPAGVKGTYRASL